MILIYPKVLSIYFERFEGLVSLLEPPGQYIINLADLLKNYNTLHILILIINNIQYLSFFVLPILSKDIPSLLSLISFYLIEASPLILLYT